MLGHILLDYVTKTVIKMVMGISYAKCLQVELLLKRMPLAAEYKMHREKEAEDWGMQIRQNRVSFLITLIDCVKLFL